MTEEELKGIAAQALNLAKLAIEQGEFQGWMFATYQRTIGLKRLSRVEALVNQKLGEAWLDDGNKKELAFYMLRFAVSHFPPDAVCFAMAANMFLPTPKFIALSIEKQQQMIDNSNHADHHRMVREGWFTIQDAINVVAQTPELVCNAIQPRERGKWEGAPQYRVFPQDQFGGRLKMFGEEKVS